MKYKIITIFIAIYCTLAFLGAGNVFAVETNVIYVKDFGALADGHTDSTGAIQRTIASAISSGKTTEIVLDAGEYRLNAQTAQSSALLLNNAKNITISGIKGKTVLMIENPSIGTFLLDGCENVTIRNVVIDYDPLPFTQGTIVAIDRINGTVDIDIDDNFGLPNEPFYAKAELRVGIKANLKGDETEYSLYSIIADSAVLVRDRIYRIKKASSANTGAFGSDNINVGDRMIYEAMRYAPQAGVCAWRSKNIAIIDITVYAGPSAATMWGVNDNIHINGLVVAIKPGSGRLVATNADGVHSFGTRNGMLIENSIISGNGDDAINIHSRPGIIMEKITSSKYKVNTGGCSDYRPGDTLQIYRKEKVLKTVKVVSVVSEPYVQTVTFDNPVYDINTGTTLSDSDNIINLSACGQGSVIRNNTFGIHSGRDILLSSHDILVENNTFRNPDGWSVSLSYDINYGEGPHAYNITIKNNTFTGAGRARFACINMMSIAAWSGKPVPGDRPIKNITIEDNKFVNPRNSIIYANGVNGLQITGNTSTTALLPANNNAPVGVYPPVILLENSNGILIRNMTITDPNPKTNTLIHIKSTVAAGLAGVKIENLTTSVGPFVTKITDDRATFTSYPQNSSKSASAGTSKTGASSEPGSTGNNASSASIASVENSKDFPSSSPSGGQSGLSSASSTDPGETGSDNSSQSISASDDTKSGKSRDLIVAVIIASVIIALAAVAIIFKFRPIGNNTSK